MVVIADDDLTGKGKIMQEGTKEQIEARGHRVTRELFEQAAELAWKIGTSGDRTIEAYDADAYKYAHKLAEALYLASYADATDETWQFVSDKLSELGPDDGYNRVEGHGVDSYHRGAKLELAEKRIEEAIESFREQIGALVSEARSELAAAEDDIPVGISPGPYATRERFRRELEVAARSEIHGRI